MELNINSPAYYTKNFGVNDAVYKYIQKSYLYFKDRKYSETLNIIGIVPIAAPQSVIVEGKYKEGLNMLDHNKAACIYII